MQQLTAQTVETLLGPDTVEDAQRFIIAARAFADVAPTFRPLFTKAFRTCREAGVDIGDALMESVCGEMYEAFRVAFDGAHIAGGELTPEGHPTFEARDFGF